MALTPKSNKTIVNGVSIAWSEIGSGTPLILIHGFWDSHRVWSKAASLLADDFRVIMIDLPGNGLSDRPDAPYTLEWYARMIASWMDAIGVEKAHFCGHSYGGGVAQWMLLEHKDRIERMALVAPGGLGNEVFMWLKYMTFPMLGRKITPLVMRYLIPVIMKFAPRYFGKRDPEELKISMALSRIPGTDLAFQRAVGSVINIFGQYMKTEDCADDVDAIPPIAIFWGEDDPILPVKQGRSMADHSTGVSLTTYPDCGHFPHLDVVDTFADDLRTFLFDSHRSRGRLFA